MAAGVQSLLLAGLGLFVAAAGYFAETSDLDMSSRVLSGSNSSDSHDLCEEIREEGLGGGTGEAVLYVLVTLFIFIGIAIICDEFFQPSLEAISDALKLSPDVAGATFLAAGSSAPELFTSMADAFGNAASVGIGTIVGSAMFNILVIVALSCAVAARSGASLDIDYRPVARDATYYTCSILLLAGFFWDAKIQWWEALLMVLVYFTYIGFMVFNETLLGKCKPMHENETEEDAAALASAAQAVMRSPGGAKVAPEELGGGNLEMVETGSTPADGAGQAGSSGEQQAEAGEKKEEEEEEEDEGLFHRFALPESPGELVFYVLSLPFLVLFTFTVPDCSHEWFTSKFEKVYWVSFFMSILWIGLLCHFMVEFSLAFACICKISPIMIGLLVLAVGTSVPDAIGSMIAAREGEADMAIANAIGSNVFDVLLGLGLPWFLASWLKNDPPGSPMPVKKSGILKFVIILLITVGVFLGILISNRWKMNLHVGVAMFVLYLAFVLFSILDEAL